MIHASIDTCCLINLLADEALLSTLREMPGEPTTFHVPNHVSEEALYLLRPSADDSSVLEKVAVDLSCYYSSGLLSQCDLETDEELASFVSLATGLDDGEAACIAIAASRGWLLATDDRLARRAAQTLGIEVVTTPSIVRSWAKKSGATEADLRLVITAIARFARFVPHHSSPDYQWWIEAGRDS